MHVQNNCINFAHFFAEKETIRKKNRQSSAYPYMNTRKHIFSFPLSLLLAVVFCFSFQFTWAAINNNTPSTSDYLKNTYYNGANGKSGSALFTALTTISEGVHYSYNKLTYDNLWDAYATSDVYPTGHEHAGKIWDMYATCYYSTSNHASTNGGPECSDGINREHSMPKSWWGNSGEAYKSNNQGCDLVHVVPTDAYVNKVRDNYAFGEVQTATNTFAISKQGTSKTTLSLTSGSTVAGTSVSVSSGTTVFEPADEYKGDFARIYMYMRARYPSLNLAQQAGGALHFTTTTSAASDTYYGLKAYSVILLMKWHRQDPVSQKEIDRNNAIEKMQGNRNPFVDYPCLAEYLWGTLAGQAFNPSTSVGSFEDGFDVGTSDGCPCAGPTITVSETTVAITSAAGSSNTATFTIAGANLTDAISISRSGTNSGLFSLSTTSIAAGSANGTTTVTVTYSPTATGSHTATLTISSTGADPKTVTLNGTCAATKTVTWKVNNVEYTTGNPTTQVVSGGKVTDLPSNPVVPSGCSGKSFVGWSATALPSETDTEPTDLFLIADDSPTITENTTFHAVFATAGSGGSGSETLECPAGTISNDAMSFSTTNFSIVHAKGTGTSFASYSPWRVYTNNTVTISGSQSITSVVITCGSTDYATTAAASTLTPNTASASASSTTCTITTSGTSLVIQPNAQTRWSKIVINYGGGTSYSGYITQCSAVTYVTLSFNANGGSGSMSSQSVPSGVATAINTCTFTAPSGKQFAGWAETSGGSVAFADGANITISANKTLYAKWEDIPTYTVTFMNGTTTLSTQTGVAGTALSVPSTPAACTGYTFEGWSTNTYAVDNTASPSIVTPTTIPAANTTYYAVFSKTETGGTPELTNNYAKITSTDDLTSGSNYVIAGYYNSNYYALNTTTGGGGSAVAYLGTTTVTPSDDVISNPDAANIWQITISGSYLNFYNADANKKLYTYTSGSGGSTKYNLGLTTGSTGINYTYSVSDDGVWTFKSSSYTSYYVEQYSGKFQMYTSTGNPIYFYKQQSTSGTTTYHTTSPDCAVPTYDLTIAASPAGYGSVSTTSVADIPSGSAVTTNGNQFTVNGTTVTATPTAATAQYTYAFSSWSNLPETVTADVTNVTANFTRTLRSYTVTFKDNFGTTLKTQTVNYGSAATAPSIPNIDCYTHGTWDKAYNNITGDLTVTVTYTIIPYTITAVPDNATHGSVTITP